MFSVISNPPEITALLIEGTRFPRENSVMQMQIYGSNPNDRIFYTGYVFMCNGGPISRNSHKQSTVAHSTVEAEYTALSDASREALSRKQIRPRTQSSFILIANYPFR